MKHWLVGMALAAALAAGGCAKTTSNGEGDGRQEPDVGGDGFVVPPSSSFSNNTSLCAAEGVPKSAVTTAVPGGMDLLDKMAAALLAEGYEVFRGPEQAVPADGSEEVVAQGDGGGRGGDATVYDISLEDWGGPRADAQDAVADTAGPPRWTGGPYLVAKAALNDVLFMTDQGVLGVASWCPAHSLGQIRRLDYALAEGMRILAEAAGPEVYDYAKETEGWVKPAAYYTLAAGGYQRSYVNESLDLTEQHAGFLSVSGKPVMTGMALFGHANSPSPHGDQVGVELLKVGQTTVAEMDEGTVAGQVVRLWDLSKIVGEGDNAVEVKCFIEDETMDWEVGVYWLFADAVFPDTAAGSLVLSLQGAPPGKMQVSKAVDELALPPLAPLF